MADEMMPHLIVDQKACRRCKTCVRVCPASNISLGVPGLSFNPSSCLGCGQCVANCPRGALSWDGHPPSRVDRRAYPEPGQIEALLAGRLPLWNFGEGAVDPAILDRLVGAVHELPADAAGLEIVALADPGIRRSLDAICLDRLEKLYVRRYSRPWVYGLWKKITPSVSGLDGIRARQALKKGSAFQGAPAMIFILGDPRRRQAGAGAWAALVSMALLAETAGLGACVHEMARLILNSDRRARRALSLGRRRRVLGILLVGRPQTEPLWSAGSRYPVRWIGELPAPGASQYIAP